MTDAFNVESRARDSVVYLDQGLDARQSGRNKQGRPQEAQVSQLRPQEREVAFHPKIDSDLDKLPNKVQDAFHDRVEMLRRGDRHSSTHPLNGPLKGWHGTTISGSFRMVHRMQGNELHVLSAANHDEAYDQGKRRAVASAENTIHRGFVLRSQWPHDATQRLSTGTAHLSDIMDHINRSGNEYWHHPDHGDLEDAKDYAYSEEHPGKWAEHTPPHEKVGGEFGVVFEGRKPHGWHPDNNESHDGPLMGNSYLPKGQSVELTGVHYHDVTGNWHRLDAQGQHVTASKLGHFSPRLRIFTHTCGLDHRLWDANQKLKPEVRRYILQSINKMWLKEYKDWSSWSRVYFAGSEASEWTNDNLEGNNDFDVLIGVNYDGFRKANPEYREWSNAEITGKMNPQFRQYNGDVWLPIRTPEDMKGVASWHPSSNLMSNGQLSATLMMDYLLPQLRAKLGSESPQFVALSTFMGLLATRHEQRARGASLPELNVSSALLSFLNQLTLTKEARQKLDAFLVDVNTNATITSSASTDLPPSSMMNSLNHKEAAAESVDPQNNYTSITTIGAAQERTLVGIVFEASYALSTIGRSAGSKTLTSTPQPVTSEQPPTEALPDGWMWTGPWSRTSYVNPDSYDIRNIKPYAAYDVSNNKWVVKPPHLPHWGLDKLPEAVRKVLRATDTLARNTLKLAEPEKTQQGAALFDAWHTDRSRAFGPNGEGWWDIANLREKWGDQAGWWAQLVECKHRYDAGFGSAPKDWSNDPYRGQVYQGVRQDAERVLDVATQHGQEWLRSIQHQSNIDSQSGKVGVQAVCRADSGRYDDRAYMSYGGSELPGRESGSPQGLRELGKPSHSYQSSRKYSPQPQDSSSTGSYSLSSESRVHSGEYLGVQQHAIVQDVLLREGSQTSIQMMRPSELANHKQRDDLDEPWNRHKIDDLKKSISEHGFVHGWGDPVRVGEDSVVNGNKRLKALRELGFDGRIPVMHV